MPRGKNIPAEVREAIFRLVQKKVSYRQVGLLFGCGISTVAAIVRRMKHSGTAEDAPKSGRPRITTSRDDSVIQRMSRRNPSLTAVDIKKSVATHHSLDVSVSTVKRRLRCADSLDDATLRKPSSARRIGKLDSSLPRSI